MNASRTALVFAPLGGVGEIGMNLALYGYGPERQRKWIAVDFGISFAGDELPGIEVLMPDIRFLVAERRNLAGILITHAHEDHFGALIELWPRINVPVYATPFTAALLEAKRLSEPGAPKIDVRVVATNARFDLGPFNVEYVNVTHSIPEAHALIIRTAAGNVLHTGDWKLDPAPVIGERTDVARLKTLGTEGCLAMIGDSTNAIREGRSPSERDVAKTLAELIGSARGRVAVTTFASNVGRIQAVAEAAQAVGREVVLVGRAMERIVQVARETGYLDSVKEFRSADVYGYLPPDKVVALCTGSQGEPRAALSRIAQDQHPEVTLAKGDRVIFSSRTIPGNEKAVGRVINGLVTQGIEVITDRTHLVHVSGHPRREEMRELYSWVRPQIAIPVHGEALHLYEHAALARACGVPEVVSCRNGDLVELTPGRAGVIDELPSGRLYRDGRLIVNGEGRTVADRRRLAFAGVISIAVALDERGSMLEEPSLDLTGLPDANAEGRSFADIVHEAVTETLDNLPRPHRRDPAAVEETLKRAVRSAVGEHWGKKPVCLVHVLVV